MITFSEYDSSGRITRSISAPDELADANKTPGVPSVSGTWSSKTHWVKDGEITERPTQQTTATGTTLSNLPNPCSVYIFRQRFEVSDGIAELDLPAEGIYFVRVESWPFIDYETIITT